jgi:hypothetical protein
MDKFIDKSDVHAINLQCATRNNPKSKFQNPKSLGFHKLPVFKFTADLFAV